MNRALLSGFIGLILVAVCGLCWVFWSALFAAVPDTVISNAPGTNVTLYGIPTIPALKPGQRLVWSIEEWVPRTNPQPSSVASRLPHPMEAPVGVQVEILTVTSNRQMTTPWTNLQGLAQTHVAVLETIDVTNIAHVFQWETRKKYLPVVR